MTADETYDFDAGLTEVDYAVAETGSLVIRHTPAHGRLLSLVPFVHVAIVEPRLFVPDLIDLFESLSRDGTGSGVTMISGPKQDGRHRNEHGHRGAWAEHREGVRAVMM